MPDFGSLHGDMIVIWKFDTAPPELKALHTGQEAAEWLVWVPRSLHASDVQELILRQAGEPGVHRRVTATGDVVYAGSFPGVRGLGLRQPLETPLSTGL